MLMLRNIASKRLLVTARKNSARMCAARNSLILVDNSTYRRNEVISASLHSVKGYSSSAGPPMFNPNDFSDLPHYDDK